MQRAGYPVGRGDHDAAAAIRCPPERTTAGGNVATDLDGLGYRDARVVVDRDGRLGPAGLLAQAGHGSTATALLTQIG